MYLYLLRHAKSDWPEGMEDFQRRLTEQGQHAAALMGQHLRSKNIHLDYVLSSLAPRALMTAQWLVAELAQPQTEIATNSILYQALVTDVLNIIHTIPDDYQHVLLVGHNPTITEVANAFTSDNISNMPTCSLYAIQFNTDTWQAVTWASGTCLFFDS